jgi:hypothetical protein
MSVRGDLARGEGTDRDARGVQAIAPGWRKIACEANGFERIGVDGDNHLWGKATKKFGQENDEPAHHRGFGVSAKITPLVAHFRDEPHDRHASWYAVRFDPLTRRQGCDPPGPVDE